MTRRLRGCLESLAGEKVPAELLLLPTPGIWRSRPPRGLHSQACCDTVSMTYSERVTRNGDERTRPFFISKTSGSLENDLGTLVELGQIQGCT